MNILCPSSNNLNQREMALKTKAIYAMRGLVVDELFDLVAQLDLSRADKMLVEGILAIYLKRKRKNENKRN